MTKVMSTLGIFENFEKTYLLLKAFIYRNNKTLKTNFLYLSHFYFMTSQAEIRMFLVWILKSRLKEGHFDFLRRFRAFKQCAPFQLGCSLKSNNRRRIDGNPIKYCIVLHANEV